MPIEDFNWDSYEEGASVADTEKQEIEEAYGKTLSQVNNHEVVEGTVISVNKREVLVDIGYKSDGVISANEFRYNPDLKPGDKVEVYIEKEEDKKGQLILSHKKARAKQGWIVSIRLLRTRKLSRALLRLVPRAA